jgi:ABC-2 type transport system ATP-binding protein
MAWSLVRDVRERGTNVVLVTHFVEEAETLCDRLAIVDGGRVKAIGTPGELVAQSRRPISVRFTANGHDLSWLSRVENVEQVRRRGSAIEVAGTGPVLARVASALVDRGIVPLDLRAERPSLEDALLELTGGSSNGGKR